MSTTLKQVLTIAVSDSGWGARMRGELESVSTNGFSVGNRLTGIGLAKSFFDLRQETKSLNRVFEGGSLGQPFDSFQYLLLNRSCRHN